MAEDPPDYHRTAALERAVATHGRDTEEEYAQHYVATLFMLGLALTPVAACVGAVLLAEWTSGWLARGAWLLFTLLIWPALHGLRGVLAIFSTLGLIVLVYKDRLVYRHGSREQEVRWSDLSAVYLRTQTDPEHIYFRPTERGQAPFIKVEWMLIKSWLEYMVLQSDDGTELRIPSTLLHYQGLVETVQCELAQRQWSKLQATLVAGQSVPFGPFTVHPDGLEYRNQHVRWVDLNNAYTEDGFVHTRNQLDGSPAFPPVPTEQVPNLAMMLFLVTDRIPGPDENHDDASASLDEN